jgi:hypothetical protein
MAFKMTNPLKQTISGANEDQETYAKTNIGKAEIELNNALAANNGESNEETDILQAEYDKLRSGKLKKQE